MKAQIQAQIGRLEKLKESAEEKADSDNDATAERYEQVIAGLEEAINVLEELTQLWD
jgi:hypothetical protein